MDPWGGGAEASSTTEFEDNFTPERTADKLSDSAQYLAQLEKRLAAVRSQNSVVENLSAYRRDCVERLLRDGCTLEPFTETESEHLIEKDD